MKIVKFKDGTYGVRRWHWLFGFQFYMFGNGIGVWGKMGGISGTNGPWIKLKTIDGAESRLKEIQREDSEIKDKGFPI